MTAVRVRGTRMGGKGKVNKTASVCEEREEGGLIQASGLNQEDIERQCYVVLKKGDLRAVGVGGGAGFGCGVKAG